MNEKEKQSELRELVETELSNVTAVRNRITNATRHWTPDRLLDERIRQEIAAKNLHIASLQLILNKIDEGLTNGPKLVNTILYRCSLCGKTFDSLPPGAKVYSEGCPNCGSQDTFYTVQEEELEE